MIRLGKGVSEEEFEEAVRVWFMGPENPFQNAEPVWLRVILYGDAVRDMLIETAWKEKRYVRLDSVGCS